MMTGRNKEAAPEEKPERGKIISFAGVECGAVIYYAVKLLSVGMKSILCIDNSGRHDLFRVVKPELAKENNDGENDRYLTDLRVSGSVTYAKDIAYSPEGFSRFDYVIVYHELDIDKEMWAQSAVRFVVTDTDRLDRIDVKEMLKKVGESLPVYVLLIDAYFGKIKDKDLIGDITDKPDEMILGMQGMAFDPGDISAKQAWQYNGAGRVKSLSPAARELLVFIYEVVNGKKASNIKKLISMAG